MRLSHHNRDARRGRIALALGFAGTMFTGLLAMAWFAALSSFMIYVLYNVYTLGLTESAASLGRAVRAFINAVGA